MIFETYPHSNLHLVLKKFGEVKPEDLTPFYIRFLEKSKARHAEFHKAYVKLSFKIIGLTILAQFHRLFNFSSRTRTAFFLPSNSRNQQ